MHPPQLQAIAAPCWKLNRGTHLRAPSLPKNFWHCAISDQGIRRAAAISFQFHLTCVSSLFSFTKLIPARMPIVRSEEHTSELQPLMRISYAVFCLKKKKHLHIHIQYISLIV